MENKRGAELFLHLFPVERLRSNEYNTGVHLLAFHVKMKCRDAVATVDMVALCRASSH